MIALTFTVLSICSAVATTQVNGVADIAFSRGWFKLAIALAFPFSPTALNLTGSDGSIAISLGTTKGGFEMPTTDFWDGLVFGFTASLMLWQDLPAVEAAMVLVVLFGFALVALTSGRAE